MTISCFVYVCAFPLHLISSRYEECDTGKRPLFVEVVFCKITVSENEKYMKKF